MSRPQHHKPRQAGFSLIELMISITLGLLIMTALVALFVNTSRTNQP
jgi:type IV pilus assembly protein PilW